MLEKIRGRHPQLENVAKKLWLGIRFTPRILILLLLTSCGKESITADQIRQIVQTEMATAKAAQPTKSIEYPLPTAIPSAEEPIVPLPVAPTATAPMAPTPEPRLPYQGVEYKTFNSAQDVAAVRGGDLNLWVPKVEIYDGIDQQGNADPSEYREVHLPDGTKKQITLSKSEWVYRGSMSDLKPEYQIPQTEETIARQLGGNVHPENIRLIRITHDRQSAGYAPWMDLWQVPEGTVVGYELMQNHQREGEIYPYELNLPPGAVIEMYDDRQTENPNDDVAATIYNPTGNPMKLFISGGTIWPWGDPVAIQIEQSNFDNGASSFATLNGKLISLSAASNIPNPYTTHYLAVVDPVSGKVSLAGLNIPSKQGAWKRKSKNLFTAADIMLNKNCTANPFPQGQRPEKNPFAGLPNNHYF